MAASIWDEVKNKVSLEDYLTNHCGVDDLVHASGNRLVACCPFHSENTPSFNVEDDRSNPAWQRWICYGQCDASGSVIDACMRKEGFLTPMEAIDFLNDLYELGLDHDTEGYERFQRGVQIAREQIERSRQEMESGSKAAQQARAYLHRRGLTDETIEAFELSVTTEKTRAGRLTIPLYDRGNHSVSVANRALFDEWPCQKCKKPVEAKTIASRYHKARKAAERGETPADDPTTCPECGAPENESKLSWLRGQHPKYRFEGDFEKSKLLYNEPRARIALRDNTDTIGYFIAEGYGEVWAAFEAGQHAASSYNGAVISEWQAAEVATLCVNAEKPLLLIPDFDSTGLSQVPRNIEIIRHVNKDVEIRVIHGLDKLSYQTQDGTVKHPKDLGEVLQNFDVATVQKVLQENQWSADEWLIRSKVEAINRRTNLPMYTREQQMEEVADVLRHVPHRISLHHLVPYFHEKWNIPEAEAQKWLYMQLPDDESAFSAQHIIKTIEQAEEESREFFLNTAVIKHGFPDIDRCIPAGGARRKQLSLVLGKSGTGKAQPLDSLLLTPSGWKTMGDIAVGDLVVGSDGKPTEVIGVYPQGERLIYEITFSDKSTVQCDAEHLWNVMTPSQRYRKQVSQTKTLEEIMRIGLRDKNDNRRWFIPLVQPVDFHNNNMLTVDPYVLGCLLGDGCFTGRSVRFTTADEEMTCHIKTRLPATVELRQGKSQNAPYEWTIGSFPRGGPNTLREELNKLNLLSTRSATKFIPHEYKTASTENRLALLRGLMDTDGSTSFVGSRKDGQPSSVLEFCTVSPQLAEDVQFIVQSLGGTAPIKISPSGYRTKKTGDYISGQPRYRLHIILPKNMNPFLLERKAQRFIRHGEPLRAIDGVRQVGMKEAQCIQVAAEDQLYVTDNFVVTHNTMLTTQILANMAQNGIRSIFFSLEMPAAQVYARAACQILDVTMEHAVEMIKEDDPRLDEINEVFKNMIIVDNVPEENRPAINMTPEKIGQIIQEINMTKFDTPADVVAIDHLGIVKVSENAPRSVQNDDLQAAGYIMQEMFSITKMMNVYTFMLQQLPKEIKEGVEFPYDAGRGGSKQTDYCDYIFCIWRPERSEEFQGPEKVEDRKLLEGQYKLKLGKNRHGMSVIAHCYFDAKNLRITPALQIVPDSDAVHGPSNVTLAEDAPPVVIEGTSEAGNDSVLAPSKGELAALNPSPQTTITTGAGDVLQELPSSIGGNVATNEEGIPTDQQELAKMLNLEPEEWATEQDNALGDYGVVKDNLVIGGDDDNTPI